MPNSTLPAADTGLPNLSRRGALAKLGLGLAASSALAVTSAVAAPDAISPELLRLIEAHRGAYAAYEKLRLKLVKAEQAYAEMKPPPLPFKDIYGRRCDDQGNEHFTLEISLGREVCTQHFLDNLACQETMSRNLSQIATPKRAKQLQALMRAFKRDGLALIDDTFAQDEAARQSSGFAAAEDEYDRSFSAERGAMLALCSYRCVTLAETRLKGGYLASDHLGEGFLTPEHIEALLRSASDV